MNSINRRSILLAGLGAAGAGALSACTNTGSSPALVSPPGSAAAASEKRRGGTGRQHKIALTAAPARVDLGGGVKAMTWAFDGRTPGKQIRLSAGDTLVAELANQLPGKTTTSIHWHGIALRNDMDGAPPTTQTAVRAGSTFTYRFVADAPGTYFFHPHVGVQLDRGLYAPLIVEDPREPLAYDDEWVVVLDDWVDGVTGTPDEVFAELKQGMGGMDMGDNTFVLMGAESDLLGGDAGDVKYPYHLVNGRVPDDPEVYTGKPGRKLRLRIINAGSDTAYRVALSGHKMTVTHTDGFPIQHQRTDALLIGMGERYDVLVTLADGVFPLVALAEGKKTSGLALVRTGSGRAPTAAVRPKELDGTVMTASRLRAAEDVRLESAAADVTHRIELTGGMMHYNWAINGKPFDMADPDANAILVEEGRRVRLDFVNTTTMWHPMHLHGHTFQLGRSGPRKDTAIVLPKKQLSVFFDADNPGQWMLHCHNAYHGEAGMMTTVAYQA
ncbi:multicopper oxidase family protein [Streptomyces massasporeus]|uniref:multicopper oxidase family protein n=1 Tax=Streptomyces massasporeus TaxID=67324 RepID=UPI0033F981F9